MNVSEVVHHLRRLGVGEALLSGPAALHVDPDGVVHASSACAGEGAREAALDPTGLEGECRCVLEALGSGNGPWELMCTLATWAQQVRGEPEGILAQSRMVRRAEHFLDPRNLPASHTLVAPSLGRAHRIVVEEVETYRERLLEQLRSQEARAEALEALGTTDDGERALVTLEEYAHRWVPAVVDALVLAHLEHEAAPGVLALVVPTAVGERLWESWERSWGRIDRTPLGPEDTPETARVACLLWDPQSGGELMLPEAALEAARRV